MKKYLKISNDLVTKKIFNFETKTLHNGYVIFKCSLKSLYEYIYIGNKNLLLKQIVSIFRDKNFIDFKRLNTGEYNKRFEHVLKIIKIQFIIFMNSLELFNKNSKFRLQIPLGLKFYIKKTKKLDKGLVKKEGGKHILATRIIKKIYHKIKIGVKIEFVKKLKSVCSYFFDILGINLKTDFNFLIRLSFNSKFWLSNNNHESIINKITFQHKIKKITKEETVKSCIGFFQNKKTQGLNFRFNDIDFSKFFFKNIRRFNEDTHGFILFMKFKDLIKKCKSFNFNNSDFFEISYIIYAFSMTFLLRPGCKRLYGHGSFSEFKKKYLKKVWLDYEDDKLNVDNILKSAYGNTIKSRNYRIEKIIGTMLQFEKENRIKINLIINKTNEKFDLIPKKVKVPKKKKKKKKSIQLEFGVPFKNNDQETGNLVIFNNPVQIIKPVINVNIISPEKRKKPSKKKKHSKKKKLSLLPPQIEKDPEKTEEEKIISEGLISKKIFDKMKFKWISQGFTKENFCSTLRANLMNKKNKKKRKREHNHKNSKRKKRKINKSKL